MKLSELTARAPLEPWAEGAKIPWDDPAFSARMLREHLSQKHDRASRRRERIDRHVEWLHQELLQEKGLQILDLGCGPGFYTSRLARLGHTCVGIDYSPASIQYARSEAEREGLSCQYHLQDLRGGRFGSGFQAGLLIFGELNAFRREDARLILTEARTALRPGGSLVLEVHTEALVRQTGQRRPSWYTATRGLFSDEPHLCLHECAWSVEHRATWERYLVIDLGSGRVTPYVGTLQAYSDREYEDLLHEAGFERLDRFASLEGGSAESHEGLFVLVAHAAKG